MFINVDHPGENQKYFETTTWSWMVHFETKSKPNLKSKVDDPSLRDTSLSFCLPPIGEYAKSYVGNHFPNNVKPQQKIFNHRLEIPILYTPENFTIFEYIRKELLILNHGFWFPFVQYPNFLFGWQFSTQTTKTTEEFVPWWTHCEARRSCCGFSVVFCAEKLQG